MPLERLHLPAILRAVAELADAATAYRPEDHPEITTAQADPSAGAPSVEAQFRWHDELDAIRDAANRLKRALGATGELRPGRVCTDQAPFGWRHFDSQFQDLDYPRPVRIGLRRLALAAIDLSGYAELRQPLEEWRQQALAQLGRGAVQVWPALSAGERAEVQPLVPAFRQAFGWPFGTDHAPPVWSGPIEIAASEEYRIIDRNSYCARPAAYLNDLARLSAQQQAEIGQRGENAPVACVAEPREAQPRPKRSVRRGDGRVKLIAALTKHHEYADGGCLHQEPVGNNQLARLAGVEPSTASAFFKKEFRTHRAYKALCRDRAGLIAALKLLNEEFSPFDLYGGRPNGE